MQFPSPPAFGEGDIEPVDIEAGLRDWPRVYAQHHRAGRELGQFASLHRLLFGSDRQAQHLPRHLSIGLLKHKRALVAKAYGYVRRITQPPRPP